MSDMIVDPAIDTIICWHRTLHDNEHSGRRGDRAARARLRRCVTLMDVVAEPQSHVLLQKLRDAGLSKKKDDAVLVLAAVLAATPPKAGSSSFASALGSGGPESQIMSPMRFGNLLKAMQSGEPELQIQALRRAVKLLGDKRFNHPKFIRDILWFNDRALRDWNYDYWQTPKSLDEAEKTAAANI